MNQYYLIISITIRQSEYDKSFNAFDEWVSNKYFGARRYLNRRTHQLGDDLVTVFSCTIVVNEVPDCAALRTEISEVVPALIIAVDVVPLTETCQLDNYVFPMWFCVQTTDETADTTSGDPALVRRCVLVRSQAEYDDLVGVKEPLPSEESCRACTGECCEPLAEMILRLVLFDASVDRWLVLSRDPSGAEQWSSPAFSPPTGSPSLRAIVSRVDGALRLDVIDTATSGVVLRAWLRGECVAQGERGAMLEWRGQHGRAWLYPCWPLPRRVACLPNECSQAESWSWLATRLGDLFAPTAVVWRDNCTECDLGSCECGAYAPSLGRVYLSIRGTVVVENGTAGRVDDDPPMYGLDVDDVSLTIKCELGQWRAVVYQGDDQSWVVPLSAASNDATLLTGTSSDGDVVVRADHPCGGEAPPGGDQPGEGAPRPCGSDPPPADPCCPYWAVEGRQWTSITGSVSLPSLGTFAPVRVTYIGPRTWRTQSNEDVDLATWEVVAYRQNSTSLGTTLDPSVRAIVWLACYEQTWYGAIPRDGEPAALVDAGTYSPGRGLITVRGGTPRDGLFSLAWLVGPCEPLLECCQSPADAPDVTALLPAELRCTPEWRFALPGRVWSLPYTADVMKYAPPGVSGAWRYTPAAVGRPSATPVIDFAFTAAPAETGAVIYRGYPALRDTPQCGTLRALVLGSPATALFMAVPSGESATGFVAPRLEVYCRDGLAEGHFVIDRPLGQTPEPPPPPPGGGGEGTPPGSGGCHCDELPPTITLSIVFDGVSSPYSKQYTLTRTTTANWVYTFVSEPDGDNVTVRLRLSLTQSLHGSLLIRVIRNDAPLLGSQPSVLVETSVDLSCRDDYTLYGEEPALYERQRVIVRVTSDQVQCAEAPPGPPPTGGGTNNLFMVPRTEQCRACGPLTREIPPAVTAFLYYYRAFSWVDSRGQRRRGYVRLPLRVVGASGTVARDQLVLQRDKQLDASGTVTYPSYRTEAGLRVLIDGDAAYLTQCCARDAPSWQWASAADKAAFCSAAASVLSNVSSWSDAAFFAATYGASPPASAALWSLRIDRAVTPDASNFVGWRGVLSWWDEPTNTAKASAERDTALAIPFESFAPLFYVDDPRPTLIPPPSCTQGVIPPAVCSLRYGLVGGLPAPYDQWRDVLWVIVSLDSACNDQGDQGPSERPNPCGQCPVLTSPPSLAPRLTVTLDGLPSARSEFLLSPCPACTVTAQPYCLTAPPLLNPPQCVDLVRLCYDTRYGWIAGIRFNESTRSRCGLPSQLYGGTFVVALRECTYDPITKQQVLKGLLSLPCWPHVLRVQLTARCQSDPILSGQLQDAPSRACVCCATPPSAVTLRITQYGPLGTYTRTLPLTGTNRWSASVNFAPQRGALYDTAQQQWVPNNAPMTVQYTVTCTCSGYRVRIDWDEQGGRQVPSGRQGSLVLPLFCEFDRTGAYTTLPNGTTTSEISVREVCRP